MCHAKPRIKVTTTGAPPLSGAGAFARLLVEAMSKRPELKVVGEEQEASAACGNRLKGGTDD